MSGESGRFELDGFVRDCRAALGEPTPEKAVREVLARALSDPGALLAMLGEPQQARIETLHRSDDLTVLNVIWGPHMTIRPHNHSMWAVIGLYGGREDNIFWRKIEEEPDSRIEAAGARSLGTGEVLPLGRDIVHSVTNPLMRLTGAIHIYGGDFFAIQRSEWDPESLRERPYEVEKTMELFERANAFRALVS